MKKEPTPTLKICVSYNFNNVSKNLILKTFSKFEANSKAANTDNLFILQLKDETFLI